MSKANILVQLDTDSEASVFDSVVAVDSGAAHLIRIGGVTPENVTPRVHGCIFTRGPDDLKHTAVFIGGSDVAAGERVLKAVTKAFLGPLRVGVMMDSNGANTTAAAAVLAAAKHVKLADARVMVLGATGPVGQRAVRLLARENAVVTAVSREAKRASEVCDTIRKRTPDARLKALALSDAQQPAALSDIQIVIAAGAAGAQLLSRAQREAAKALRVAIDLNAVPPVGLEGIEIGDRAKEQAGVMCYGALGVGGTKMKIHKAAVAALFENRELVLDAEEIYELGKKLS